MTVLVTFQRPPVSYATSLRMYERRDVRAGDKGPRAGVPYGSLREASQRGGSNGGWGSIVRDGGSSMRRWRLNWRVVGRCPIIVSPQKSLSQADNLRPKIRTARRLPERDGFLPVNCRLGRDFSGGGRSYNRETFYGAGVMYNNDFRIIMNPQSILCA